jgi:hypothetical protein
LNKLRTAVSPAARSRPNAAGQPPV